MIAFPLRRQPCAEPTTSAQYAAARIVAFHGSIDAALRAHDAWGRTGLGRSKPSGMDRPSPCRAEIRAALIAFKEPNP